MSEYVIRVRQTTDGYHATIREAAPGSSLDVRSAGTPPAVGAAATAPAAILQAVIAARIPETPCEAHRRPYAV